MPKATAEQARWSRGNCSCNGRGSEVVIAPSLLAADFTNLKSALRPLRSAGIEWLHLDVMDGHFVPNISFGIPVIKAIRPLDRALNFDVHLMISDPRKYYREFAEAGAQSITFHVEAAGTDSGSLLRAIRRLGLTAGISLKPRTPISRIEPYLKDVDLALVMTVEPGFGGQRLIPATLAKVRELCLLRERHNLSYLIQVDGGIDTTTAGLAVAAGADVVVAGTAVFRDGAVRENIKSLRQSMGAH